MGKAIIAVDQTDITISHSIVRDAVKDIVKQTGFDPEASLVFNDQTVDSPRHLKNMFDGCTQPDGTRTQYKSYVFIEYTDKTTEDGWVQSQRARNLTRPLFNDPHTGIRIDPRYIQHEVKASIRFRSNSRVKLTHWLNMLRSTDAIRTHLGYVDISYDYALPPAFLDFIVDAWGNMDSHWTATPSLKDYLQEGFREDIQKRSNLDQSHTDIVAFEILKNTEGLADDALFWNEEEIAAGIYECTLEYTFRYERIVAMELTYPAVIYNKFIDKSYVEAFHHTFRLRNDENYDRPITFIDGDLRSYEVNYYYIGDGGTRMVPWDDWFPKFPRPDTQTVSIFPIQVDDDDPTNLFNLADIPEDYVPEAFMTYLKEESDYLNVFNGCLASIELYSVGEEEEMITTEIDSSGQVRSKRPMDSTRRNYVRFGLKKDIPSIHPERLKKLLNMGETAIGLFKLYDVTVTHTDDHLRWQREVGFDMSPGRDKTIPSLLLMTGDSISDYSFTRWVRKLNGTNEWFVNLRPMMPKYVGQYNMTASR